MERQSFMRWAIIAVFITIAVGCHEEPVQIAPGAGCGTCEDPPPGGGTVELSPAVNSFRPRRGIVGTQVKISGNRFHPTPSSNTVTFDGVQAQVISSTGSTIVASVPPGATSGSISVTVNGLTGTSASIFQVMDIPINGLVAFYPFDGNANDISSNQLHGNVTGAALSVDRSGNANSAYFFDGMDDYINMGNPVPLQITNSITLSVWIKQTHISHIDNIISKLASSSEKRGYQLCTNYYLGTTTAGVDMFTYLYPSCVYTTAKFGKLGPSSWEFFTVTRNDRVARFYQNGIFLYEKLYPLDCQLNSTQGNFIVARADLTAGVGSGNFTGNIDDVAVYDRALSDQEVVKLYQQNILQ
jgi:hypothetical protein